MACNMFSLFFGLSRMMDDAPDAERVSAGKPSPSLIHPVQPMSCRTTLMTDLDCAS